tara:strand:- start:392 stop:3007 length:2616 start_codon:yes stop_codon:yes gene_type:complete
MSKSRDIADSAATINYIDTVTSDVQTQLNTLDTALDNISVTSGTLTKTFASGESASISLTSSVLAPVVSVIKEVPQTGVTNNNWDVNSTTENYTRLDSAPATTLGWVNGEVSGSSFVNSFSLTTTAAAGVALSADGTKMYVTDTNTDTVRQYSLSTPYSVSGVTYDSVSFSVATEQTQPYGIAFNANGTKMFIAGFSPARVSEYSLSTAWDISSASITANVALSGTVTGVSFSTDGTKMYIAAYVSVIEYSLSSAFDITTASLSYTKGSLNTIYGVTFNADGTKMYLPDDSSDRVRQYVLSTAWDLSTSGSFTEFVVSSQLSTIRGIYSSAQGDLYLIEDSTTDTVFQYAIPQKLSLGTGSFASADVGKTVEANSGAFALTATDGSYVRTIAPTSYDQVASGDWSMYGVVYNNTDGDLELSGVTTGQFDISTSVYSQNFYVGTQESTPQGVTFSTDGTKMYIVGSVHNTVKEYELSVGFDVSTAVYARDFDVSAQESNPRDITFNTDGTKMFITGQVGDDVNEYALSQGFNVTTAVYTTAYGVGTQESEPQGVTFSTDGFKMYIVGTANNTVFQYNLTTAFSLAAGTYTASFSVSSQHSGAQAVRFNADGTKMFVVGYNADIVSEYSLATGFNITTASFSHSFSVASQEILPSGLAFNAEGTKMYVVGWNGDYVSEYDLGATTIPSGYQAAHTTASIDTTYWTDINSMTANQNAGDGEVYYCISTDDRTTWTVIKDVGGERGIVRNNSGTWQYNSNATYASETWVNGATNTELDTLSEAMGTAQNRMDKTQLDAVTDPNHIALGNDLDLAIVFNMTAGSAVPSSNGVAINYDANVLNKGAVLGTDYDFDAPTQNSVRITALAGNNLKVRVV